MKAFFSDQTAEARRTILIYSWNSPWKHETNKILVAQHVPALQMKRFCTDAMKTQREEGLQFGGFNTVINGVEIWSS
jgi:hypothetical protein